MGWVIDRRGGKDFVWSNGEISGYRAMNALLPGDARRRHRLFERGFAPRRRRTIPEEVGARVLDVLVPPTTAQSRQRGRYPSERVACNGWRPATSTARS